MSGSKPEAAKAPPVDITKARWRWATFGGELMLVTEGYGSKVVICGSANRALLTRDPVNGALRKLKETDAVAELLLMAPEWRDLAQMYKTQNDTMAQIGAAREKQFTKCREERDSLLNIGTYLIWSNEHGAWWRPNSCGYTIELEAAGRYPRKEALAICKRAHGGGRPGKPPPEIPIREQDAEECNLMETPRDA